ncbi:MAG: ABC transporter permease [Opitutaceae bacterium]|nr:ABC transporter permease [Opitutaceae bacterium]
MPSDSRLALRVLIKDRAFALIAVFVLALGICAVTTQFSVVNGVMLRGFSFPNAARLVSVNFIDPTQTTAFGTAGQIASLDFDELQPAQRSFELMANYLNGSTVNVTIDGTPQRFTGAYVGEHFLRILGVAPALGRDFSAADNRPGAEKVALISDQIWRREFGGNREIVGKAIRLNGKAATIVGVMPPGFSFPTNEQLWIPLYNEYPPPTRNDPQAVAPAVLALLKPGVTLAQATAEMTIHAQRSAADYPETNKAFNTGEVSPLIDAFLGGPIKGLLWTMLGFCVGVLLIACANVMNMQFARATTRAKELAIRSSLGATRWRLIRQMVTESFVVAAVGAVVGVAGAFWAVDYLSAIIRNQENPPPAWITFTIDGPTLACTVAAALLAALASGFVPAWLSSRSAAAAALKEGGRGNTNRTVNFITRSLVVLQIIVSCVLLIGSLLQVRSIVAQQNIDFGYDTGTIMTARMGLMGGDYPSPEARQLFFERLLRSLQGNPEFAATALTSRFRMVFSGNGPVEIEGKEYKENRDRTNANFEQISAGFFEVTGQRLLEGRDFRNDDSDTKLPVAVVNAAFARKHFGNQSPLGRRFRTTAPDGTQAGPWRSIAGVVSTIRMLGPFNPPNVDESGFYVPFFATPFGPVPPTPVASQFATVLVKPRGGQQAEALANALRREVQKVDPNLPLYFVATPKANIEGFIAQNRIIATMFSLFGLVAVALSAVGLYGVMSYSVQQRTQEFGVRMALGADQQRILRMVLRQGAQQLALGLGIGLGFSLLVAVAGRSAIQNVLFQVSPLDPLTYLGVTTVIILVSIVATLVPALRASQVHPNEALRQE